MDTQVAKTILHQIGPQALYMMGADHIAALSNGVQFRIKGCRKINVIRIKLNSLDLYDLTFYKFVKADLTCEPREEVNGLYFDQLKPVIEKRTGLYLSL